jgi:homoserine kinase type II
MLESAGGFSGAQLWSVTTPAGELLLRRWPPGTTQNRVEAISWLLSQVRARGLEIVPLPVRVADRTAWTVSYDGSLWTMQQWRPGKAIEPRPPSPTQLAAAVQALARFHVAASFCQDGDCIRDTEFARQSDGPAPGLRSRARLAEDYLGQGLARLQRANVPAGLAALQPRRARLLPLFESLAPQLLAASQAAMSWHVPLLACLRDIRGEHILFTGDEVTGLIDFDAMRIDCVATDLARLLGDYAGDDTDLWQFGLDAYHEVRPLSQQERLLVQHYDRFAVLLTGTQWLDWMLLEGKEFDLAQVLPRIDATLERLEHLRDELRTSAGIKF